MWWLWVCACAAAAVSHAAQWRFTHDIYNMSVHENSAPRTLAVPRAGEQAPAITVPRATARVKFRVRAGDADRLFRADERTLGGVSFVQLRTRAGHVLNRERRATYTLTVRATSTAEEGHTIEADTQIHLTVEDVDDLEPLFLPTEYEATLPEDSPPMSSVARVTAEDADLGLGGEVYYSMGDVERGFVVHPTTGVVYLTRPLNYSVKAMHEVAVLARDRAATLTDPPSTRPPARATLTVHVLPVNVHAPQLHVRHLPQVTADDVDEIFAIVSATDADEGEDGRVARVDVVQGDPDGHFRLRAGEGPGEWLLLLHPLLRGTAPASYNLTLRARDAGRPPREGYATVAARRGRARSARPVFGRAVYSASVHERAPPGTPLVRLKLARREADDVYIEIVGGNEGGEFRVNAESGMLYTAVQLDAERRARYTLTVSAVDQGEAGVRDQSSAKVEVTVIDDNDNDPVFENDEMDVELDENGPPRTLVARAHAKDADSGENAYVSYSIANLQAVPFEIDHFTGAVYTSRRLDYESMRRRYEIIIRAGDWGQPYRRRAQCTLRVRLRDVNDNRPQWERTHCTTHVSRASHAGKHITTLSAIDYDAGDVVTYRILAGNEDGCFALDSATGALSLACDLRTVRADVRVINVTATDGAHFADTTSLSLLLTNAPDDGRPPECRDTGVIRRLAELLAAAARANAPPLEDDPPPAPGRYGRNAHSPQFKDFPLELRVNESVSLGSTLVTLAAEDRDLGYNGLLSFAISGGDPDSAFRIDPDTGELQVVGYLDREREEEYFLNVTVYDGGVPCKSTSRLLPITVLDANDNAPVFDKSVANFVLAENALNGTVVFRAKATDRDAGAFGEIEYSLEGDADGGLCVDGRGALYVCATLDRERGDTLEVRIVATDGGGRRAVAVVRVRLDDVNDNAPIFEESTLSARVRDDVPVGAPVAWLRAADADEGDAGRVRYRLADGEEDAFRVEEWSGAVLVSALAADRSAYALQVVAEDHGTPPLSSTATLLVELIRVDRNLHAPEFPSQLAAGKVRENRPAGTRVLSTPAVDRDAPGRDSRLHYYIRDGSGVGYFSVDDAGIVHTVQPLDREMTPHFWVTLCAEDHGVVPKHACIQVFIEVEDENDMFPWSGQAEYVAVVGEDAGQGTGVMRLDANDADEGGNVSMRIVAGNPAGLLQMQAHTGLLVTTGRKLDREQSPRLALDVRLSDGELASTVRVTVTLLDVNDHAPAFLEQFYSVRFPVSAGEVPLGADSRESDSDNELSDDEDKERWTSDDREPTEHDLYLLTVLAVDPDEGVNGTVRYSLATRGSAQHFWIQEHTGRVYGSNTPASYRELAARACDCATPPRCTTARVAVRPCASPPPPVPPGASPVWRPPPPAPLTVTELDAPGFLVAVLQPPAGAPLLYYDIVDGDPRREFFVGRENGNILLSRRLLWERQQHYKLNVSVTDGTQVTHTAVHVDVVNDINEQGVQFTQQHYQVEIGEDAAIGTIVAQVSADGVQPLLYGVLNTQRTDTERTFTLNARSGHLVLRDTPAPGPHAITVWARDQAPHTMRAHARVTVHVRRVRRATWPRRTATAVVHRDARRGDEVVRLRPQGARRCRTAGGDAGPALMVDDECLVTVGGPMPARDELSLLVRADGEDDAPGPVLALRVLLTAGDGSKPTFVEVPRGAVKEGVAGASVGRVSATGRSPLHFFVSGPDAAFFSIHPLSGDVYTAVPLDHEARAHYTINIHATDMDGVEASSRMQVDVIDENEHAPYFARGVYQGRIYEDAPKGQMVWDESQLRPLTLATIDLDSPAHTQRAFRIPEPEYAAMFAISDVTGAVRLLDALDYETKSTYTFAVQVMDGSRTPVAGVSEAMLTVQVLDVDDCAPAFARQHYEATLTMPAHVGQVVTRLKATDPDPGPTPIEYSIESGDPHGSFTIDHHGALTVAQADDLQQRYTLRVRATDGRHSANTRLHVSVVPPDDSGLAFARADYYVSVAENGSAPTTLLVLDVLGAALGEHVAFTMLDEAPFTLGATSGALRTTGLPLDREHRDSYTLHVEARSGARAARTRVHVTVEDVNDNCPTFVSAPLSASLAVGDDGEELLRLQAEDKDVGENGAVRYEMMRGHGELFAVERATGKLRLRRPAAAAEYQLRLAAYDGGSPACGAQHELSLRLLPAGAPSWPVLAPLQVSMRSALSTPLTAPLYATSPLRHYFLYGIEQQDPPDLFYLIYDDEHELDPSGWELGAGAVRLAARSALWRSGVQGAKVRLSAEDPASGASAPLDVHVHLTAPPRPPLIAPPPPTHITITEASPPHALLLTINVTNVGGNMEYIVYDEEYGNRSGHFHAVGHHDGADVRLVNRLDREARRTHRLRLRVRDDATQLSTTVAFTVHVGDVNDNAPRMEACGNATVGGNATAGQLVARVRAIDKDDGDTLTYYMNDAHMALDIDAATGVITLVDVDAWQRATAATGAVRVAVVVSDGAHEDACQLTVMAAARNAHSPRFTRAEYAAHWSTAGALLDVRATDEDAGIYGTVRYSIPSPWHNARFSVDAVTGAVAALEPPGTMRSPLTLPILATDGGGRVALSLVRVSLARDVIARFPFAEYCVTLSRDRNDTLPFITMQAEGGDNVTYEMYSEDGSHRTFVIDARTGDIAIRHNVTHIDRDRIGVWVRAGSARAAVMVRLTSAVSVAVTHTELAISEDTAPGTLLYTTGHSMSAARHRLVGDTEYFAVDGEGALTLSTMLDRETAETLHVAVITETGEQCGTSAVRLRVRDVNDNPPQFLANVYKLTIAHNTPISEQILQVCAVDPDEGANGEVRYALLDNADIFTVDAISGVLAVSAQLSRHNYTVRVVATDGGRAVRSAMTTVIVTVGSALRRDTLHAPDMWVTVAEDERPHATLLTVPVPVGARVMMLHGDDARMRIDALSGELRLAAHLDYEMRHSYNITYAITDGENTAIGTLYVHVQDVNDNPPLCPPSPLSADVLESAPPGTTILTLDIADADTTADNTLTAHGEGAHTFAVRTLANGQYALTTATTLDRENAPLLNITLTAVDNEHKQWSCSLQVLIEVLDVNDNAPQFSAAEYKVSVPEDAAVNAAVAVMRAHDADEGDNGRVTYALEGHEDAFAVDERGVVWLRAELDRERRAHYRLRVIADDHGTPPRTASAELLVLVADVNDNPPEFSARQYGAAVAEDAAVGATLLRVQASSRDEGRNAEVQYTLVGEAGPFALDARTGVLSVARPMDRERTSHYALTALAQDGGTPPLSATADITVRIMDINDNAPQFTHDIYTGTVKEDAPVGQRIIQVIANDLDDGMNARVMYSISDEGGALAVDPHTGHVTLARHADRESMDVIHARVTATDRGEPPLATHARLQVHVLDVNDNAPVVPPQVAAVVPEDAPLESLVLTLQPMDADAAPNAAPFAYDLRAGDPARAFRLDRDGSLRVIGALDRRVRDHYELQVRVFDNGAPPLYSDTLLRVKVVERSRHPPQMETLDVRVFTYMEQFPGGRLGIVTATDRDAHDRLAFSLSAGPHAHLFALDARSGALTAAPLEEGKYSLRVITSDGRHSHSAPVTVTVSSLAPALLAGAVPLRLREVAPETFLREHRAGLMAATEAAAGAPAELLGCWPGGEGRARRQVATDLVVAVAARGVDASTLRARLTARLEALERGAGLVVEGMPRAPCGVRAGAALRLVSARGCSLISPELSLDCPPPPPPAWSLSGGAPLVFRALPTLSPQPIADELVLSLRVRTFIPNAILARATGDYDYNILEMVNGVVQFRMELGGGGAHARAGGRVDDGGWHSVRLERRGRAAVLTVDKATAAVRAPAAAQVMDARTATLHVGEGLRGCLAHVVLEGGELLLEGDATAASGHCTAQAATACDITPCLNGGNCTMNGGQAECSCGTRFRGERCQWDEEPCASSPCLHGGTCVAAAAPALGRYRCSCAPGLGGERCERGRWCGRDACAMGETCEEGTRGAVCRPGVECDSDVCGDPLIDAVTVSDGRRGDWTARVMEWARGAGWWAWGGAALVGASLLGAMVALVACAVARSRTTTATDEAYAPHNNKEELLNPRALDAKRASKLSNLEAVRAPPPRLDTVRNYGAAGDELECMPADYRRNLNVDLDHKADHKPWSEQMHLHTFADNKIYNDLKGARATPPPALERRDNRLRGGAGRALEGRLVGGYHWDCSDWRGGGAGAATGGQSEVPHSTDSCSPRTSPAPPTIDDDDDDDDEFHASQYLLHPDQYLPPAASPPPITAADCVSLLTIEERRSLVGSRGSLRLCEIEDSDCDERHTAV